MTRVERLQVILEDVTKQIQEDIECAKAEEALQKSKVDAPRCVYAMQNITTLPGKQRTFEGKKKILVSTKEDIQTQSVEIMQQIEDNSGLLEGFVFEMTFKACTDAVKRVKIQVQILKLLGANVEYKEVKKEDICTVKVGGFDFTDGNSIIITTVDGNKVKYTL